jgi:hypothetical protein
MHASETVGPMAANGVQIFMAGHSVAYTFVGKDQRTRVSAHLAIENYTAVQVYGTVAMNYVHLGAHERACEGATARSSNIKRDN